MADRLLKYGSLLFVVNVFAAFVNYLFHVVLGRMLGPAEYGAFASLLAFFYVLSAPTLTIQTTLANFVSKFNFLKKFDEVGCLLSRATKKFLVYFSAAFVLIALFSGTISDFLHISSPLPVILLGLLVLFYSLLFVPLGFLQGLQRFVEFSATSLLMSVLKLLLAVLFVWLGFAVSGALFGFALAALIALFLGLFFLRGFFGGKKVLVGKKAIYAYSFPVLAAFFCLMVLIHVDVVLVKHFFSSVDAGNYAVASVLAKVIYFMALSLAIVFFPMAAEEANPRKVFSLLKKGLIYVFAFSSLVAFVYWFFPYFVVLLFFGLPYVNSAGLIGLFGLAMTFFALTNVLVYYSLALNKKRFLFPLIFFTFSEPVLILFFHASLVQVLHIMVSVNALLFFSLLINMLLGVNKKKVQRIPFSGP